MLYVVLPPDWLKAEFPEVRTEQLECSFEEALEFNAAGYNLFYYPNCPKNPGTAFIKAHEVDQFDYVFVDCDLKDGFWPDKDTFVAELHRWGPTPTRIVDSGNGIHAYWKVVDLDAHSFLRLQRRAARHFSTDLAVSQLKQLMRVAPSMNTKDPLNYKLCDILSSSDIEYTAECLDKALPIISQEDENYCQTHYDKAYQLESDIKIDERIPEKFSRLLRTSKEVKEIWRSASDDRSKTDYRLAHILYAEDFTKEEALSVLVNCSKALSRAPIHRYNYALNIADKIWPAASDEPTVQLSHSVADILARTGNIKGTPFPCWEVFDGTHNGFRLTQVMGLIGPSGGGKTTLAMNFFYWFIKRNPQYIHVFVSLEQPQEEIADRWVKITQGNDKLHDRVHVLSNYNEDGSYRNLSLSEIETYIVDLEKRLNTKVGCVVIDHIGVLKKQSKEGENQGLIDVCHGMKAFAKRTNTFLVMQSQTSREKAAGGDVELDKDAAYGTSMFEWYCDYVVTTWQPLKRIYTQAPNMLCSAFKYAKIRHKNTRRDAIKEDAVYILMFDPESELLSEMTQIDEEAYETWSSIATNIRNKDRRREPKKMTKIDWTGKGDKNGEVKHNRDSGGSTGPNRVPGG